MDTTLLVQTKDSKHKDSEPGQQKMLTTLVIEKFHLVQAPLRKALEGLPYIQSILTISHPSEAGDLLQHVSPDIIVLSTSVSLKEILSVTKIVRTRCPEAGIIVIVGNAAPEASRLLIKSGIMGILDESSTEQDLRNAVEACVTGNIFHSRSVYDHLLASSKKAGSLTTREMQVLALILEGADNHSISQRLYVTIKTVEAHITRIYSKLQVSSRAQAILRTQELCLF